jgi:nucleotide-binding universal stress UspA family protein
VEEAAIAKIRRIVCPVDFSEASAAAIEYALDLAADTKAEVRFVHVYQIPVYALSGGEIVGGRELAAQLGKGLQGELDALEKKYAGRGTKLDTHLIEGVPHVEIVRIAKELPADMIVMGTHGRGGVSHFLLGSVAERVVRTAECPVLTVRQPKTK